MKTGAQWFWFLLVLFVVFPPAFLQAQQNGQVTGLVLDPTGNPIPGVKVALLNHSIGLKQEQTTDADGRYTFLQVKPGGGYVLTATASNLEPYVAQQQFSVSVNDLKLVRPPIVLRPPVQEIQVAETKAPPGVAPPPKPEQAAPPTEAALPTPEQPAQPSGQKPPEVTTAQAPPPAPPPPQPGPVQPPPPPRPTISPDESPILSGVVDSNAAHNLPLANRDFTALALLVPGTYPLEQGSPVQGASLVVNGVRGNMNNFLLDGTDNNDYTVNQSLPFQIVEAMQEFRVQTSTSTAAFGRTAGAQINVVSQSGNNQWHGELFEFNRNAALNANNAISTYAPGTFNAFAQYARVNEIASGSSTSFPTPVLSDPTLNKIFHQGTYDPLNTNQFGANIGGPIKMDKAFFFFNWESLRGTNNRPVMERAPDLTSRSASGCAAISVSCDPAVQTLLNLYPLPNVPTSSVVNSDGNPVSNQALADFLGNSGAFFVGNSANYTNSDNYLARVDFTPSSSRTLSFKYNYQTFTQVQGGSLPQISSYPGSGVRANGQNQNFSFNYVQNFGTSSVNKFVFGWNRFSFHTLSLDHTLDAGNYFQNLNFNNGGLPSVLIGGFESTSGPYSNLGATFSAPYVRKDNVWSFADNFSKVWGRHTLEVGGGYTYDRLNIDNETAARGLVTFFSVPYALETGSADFASIARVSPQFGGNNGVGSLARTFSDNSFALYAQDTWRLRPNVTVYYGLRYEVHQAPVEANNRLVNDYPGACTDPNGLQLVCLIRAGQKQIYDSDGTSVGTANFTAPRAGFNTDYNNFGPRVGISWSPGSTGETVFRAGFAVTFDQQALEPSVNMLLNPPFVQQTASLNFTGGSLGQTLPFSLDLATTYPAGFLTQGQVVPNPPNAPFPSTYWFPQPYSITARDPKTRTPYIYQYHFGIEQQLGNQNVLGITYVGSIGRKLPANLLLLECTSSDFNGPDPGLCLPPLGVGKGTSLSDSVLFQENEANSSFNSLQVQLRTRSYHGLSLQAYYQWGHSIDNAPSPAAPVFLLSPSAASIMANLLIINRDQLTAVNNANPALTLRPGLPIITTADLLPNNTTNVASLAGERASSDFDIRNRFVVAYTYAIPQWKRAGLLGNGWQLAGITTVQSGQPYSVYANFFGVPLRPDPNGPTRINNSNANGAIDNALPAGCNVSFSCMGTSQTSSFDTNPTFSFQPGSLARNTFYGPYFVNFDFSVLKNTRVAEGMTLQFRAEFFNIFNRANLRQPFSQSGQYESNPLDPSQANTVVPNPFFGQILQANSARQIQFGIKFVF